MRKFLGWLAGILASAIVVWFGWYLSRPAPTTTFEGMVINAAAGAPLQDAIVSVEIPGATNSGPFHNATDQNGAYLLVFSGLGKLKGATIGVEARGFQTGPPVSLGSVASDNRYDFTLMPLTSASAGGGKGEVVRPGIAAHLPTYVPKPMEKAFKFSLQPKP